MLKAISRLPKLHLDSKDQIEANLKRADAKCLRIAKARKEGDVPTLLEAKNDIEKYTQKSIDLFESRLASEKEKKTEKAPKEPKQI